MDKTLSEEPPLRPNDGRLESWKKIAAYLRRDVTTVQRWEKREGMPVHRQVHDKMGSVYAFRKELDDWTHRRSAPPCVSLDPDTASDRASALPRWAVIAAAGALATIAAALIGFVRSDHFWRNPIAEATFSSVTGFEGQNEAAAVSRDGQFIAFLSDRGGRSDVWLTQVGSGQFHNLTRGVGELVNRSIRTLGFSPDGSLVTFWLRKQSRTPGQDIGIWAVPTLGGELQPYLEGVAEAAWSVDGTRLAYHTPGPGDPLFISDGSGLTHNAPVLVAPAGQHMHFPIWAPDNRIYVIKGTLPDQLDVWRVQPEGDAPERITWQDTRVSYPVFLDRRTLLYLATASDGSGPSIYAMDVERRVPHRLTSSVEEYTSLAATADGRRLIATVSEPEPTLWRLAITDELARESLPERITLGTGSGSAPRLGPDCLLYTASAGTGESIWKISSTGAAQLWSAPDVKLVGSPAISADGHSIAFSVKQQGQTKLYTMQTDGSRLRMVIDSLELRGTPAWAPDGRSVMSAADENGVTHLFNISLEGQTPTPFLRDDSVDPTWSSDGRFIIYSGPDIGTRFTVKAANAHSAAYSLPPLELTRGARHLALLPGGRKLVFLQGELQHKDLWSVDLETGERQQLTRIPVDFDVRDFDISPDGRQAVLERAQSRSHVVSIDRPR